MADEQTPPTEDTENQNPGEVVAPEIAPENSEEEAAHAVEPTLSEKDVEPEIVPAGESSKLKRFFHAYWAKKKWTLPVTVLALLIILLALPWTRYPILGIVLKKDATVVVLDSVTDQPVTDAEVQVAGQTLKTDNHGKAVAHLKVGEHAVVVTKKYYKTFNAAVFVGISGTPGLKVSAVATGRQVPIVLADYVTGRPLENAVITANGSSAKTDKNGKATLVLPAQGTAAKASITRDSFNTSAVSVTITSHDVNTNHFTLTPTGKIYFLSNLSGKIDVVKTDLDGKNRKTVLAGTGTEDTYTTSLLASRDWKYLALLSKRDGKQGVYLLETATDKATNIDGGSDNATFSLVGWSGNTFVYQVTRGNVQSWQSNASAIKSYDAANSKLFNIDQTTGSGTGLYDYDNTSFGAVTLIDNQIVYTKNLGASAVGRLDGKSASLLIANNDGTGKKTIKDFPAPATSQYYHAVNVEQYEPKALYLQVYENPTAPTYYEYENGTVTQKSDITDDTWNKGYPTYLISPSSKQSFWSEVRDNKNALFVGNNEGGAGKQIAKLSEFKPYGWYTDNYLLVTKNGSELYVMAPDGSKPPVKLSDYYKPQVSYNGYGGGYGGI